MCDEDIREVCIYNNMTSKDRGGGLYCNMETETRGDGEKDIYKTDPARHPTPRADHTDSEPPSACSTFKPANLANATVVDQSDMAFQWSQTATTIATCQSWCDAPICHEPGEQHSGNWFA